MKKLCFIVFVLVLFIVPVSASACPFYLGMFVSALTGAATASVFPLVLLPPPPPPPQTLIASIFAGGILPPLPSSFEEMKAVARATEFVPLNPFVVLLIF